MTVALNISQELLDRAVKTSGQKNLDILVESALRLFLSEKKTSDNFSQASIKQYKGKVDLSDMDLDLLRSRN